MAKYRYDITAALKAGATPEQLTAYFQSEQQKGNNYTVQGELPASPKQVSFEKKSDWTDLLPVVGAIGGSFLPGIGTIAGGMAGAGIGALAKQAIKGDGVDLGEIGKETALAGVGGAVGKGVGYVAGKVVPNVTKWAGGAVAEKAAQGLGKASPTAWRNAADQHGVDLNQLIVKYVPKVGSYDDILGPVEKRGWGGTIQQSMSEAETQIKKTIKDAGSNIRIPSEVFIPELQKEAKVLSMLPGNENKIDAINTIVKQFETQYRGGLSAKRALDLKRAADSKFGKAVVQDEVGSTATMAQKMVANASRSILKRMFPEIKDALDQQTDLYTIQGVLNHARGISKTQGSEIRLGAFNSIMDFVNPKKVLWDAPSQNPWLATNVMMPMGKAMAGATEKGVSNLPTRLGIGTGAVIGQPGSDNNQSSQQQTDAPPDSPYNYNEGNNPYSQFNHDGSIPQLNDNSQGMSVQEAEAQMKTQTLNPYGATPQELYKEYVNATQAGDSKTASFLYKMYGDEIKFQKEQGGGAPKPLPVAAQTQVNLAKSGNRGLAEAASIYQQDPSILTKQLVPGQWVSRRFDSAMFRTVEALLRARSGAAVPETEVRRYLTKYGPQFGDSPEVVGFKFQQLQQDFADVLNGASNTAGSGTLPADPSQVTF